MQNTLDTIVPKVVSKFPPSETNAAPFPMDNTHSSTTQLVLVLRDREFYV